MSKNQLPRTIVYSAGQPHSIDSMTQSVAFDGGDFVVMQTDSFSGDALVEQNLRLQRDDGVMDFTAEQITALIRTFTQSGGVITQKTQNFIQSTQGRGVLWTKSVYEN